MRCRRCDSSLISPFNLDRLSALTDKTETRTEMSTVNESDGAPGKRSSGWGEDETESERTLRWLHSASKALTRAWMGLKFPVDTKAFKSIEEEKTGENTMMGRLSTIRQTNEGIATALSGIGKMATAENANDIEVLRHAMRTIHCPAVDEMMRDVYVIAKWGRDQFFKTRTTTTHVPSQASEGSNVSGQS